MRARPSVIAKIKMQPASGGAWDMLHDQGFSLPGSPGGDGIPKMPQDITDLSDKALMRLWSEISAWQEFLTVQIACARVDERATEKAVERARATTISSNATGKASDRVAVLKAQFESDPESMELVDEYERAYAYRTLVEALHTNVERNSALISRELTRRTSDSTRSRKWDLSE